MVAHRELEEGYCKQVGLFAGKVKLRAGITLLCWGLIASTILCPLGFWSE